MAYEDNFSGWQRALEDNKIKIKTFLEEDKITAINRLIKTGLPTYEYYFIKLKEIYEDESKLQELYEKFLGMIVVRACSEEKRLQRYTIIGKDVKSIIKYFKSKIENSETESYVIIVNEYDPAKFCGIVISEPEKAVIELVKEPNLEKLSHGQTTPYSAEFSKRNLSHSLNKITYLNVESPEIKKIIEEVIKYLCKGNLSGGIHEMSPMQGYFEFVISQKTNELKFIDYRPIN
jgi:hypothetical protein